MEQAKVPLTLDKVGADSLLLIFAFLPPLLLITTMERVCKSFSGLRLGSISDTLNRSLCLAFPQMKLEHLPESQWTYDEFKNLYLKFFFDISERPLLFSNFSLKILRDWMDDRPTGGHINDLNNLAVLRRAGFLSSLYSRVRVVDFLSKSLCFSLMVIRNRIDDGMLDGELDFVDVTSILKIVVKYAFVVRLFRNSFTVSKYPLLSEFWKTGVLDRPHLPYTPAQYLLDVSETDFCQLNKMCSKIETIEDFDFIFPGDILEQAGANTLQYKEAVLTLIARSNMWLQDNPSVDGIFQPWEYDRVREYSSDGLYGIGSNQHDGEGNSVYWEAYMRALRSSKDWGYMRPYNVRNPEGDDDDLGDLQIDVFFPPMQWKAYVNALEMAIIFGDSWL